MEIIKDITKNEIASFQLFIKKFNFEFKDDKYKIYYFEDNGNEIREIRVKKNNDIIFNIPYSINHEKVLDDIEIMPRFMYRRFQEYLENYGKNLKWNFPTN